MSNDKETVTIQIPESFAFGNYEADDFDRVLSFLNWSLKDNVIEVIAGKQALQEDILLDF